MRRILEYALSLVSRPLAGVPVGSPTYVQVRSEHALTKTFQRSAVSRAVIAILESFLALGLRSVNVYVQQATHHLRTAIAVDFASARVWNAAARLGRAPGEAEVAAVSEVLRSGWIARGPKSREFEAALATYRADVSP